MTFSENETSPLLERFITYKLVIQGRSPKTVCEYHLDLRLFFRFIIATKNGTDVFSAVFEKIDISCVDEEFVKKITNVIMSFEFMSYLFKDRKCAAARGTASFPL